MADKAAPLPASSGGLMRFFEDETKGFKIRSKNSSFNSNWLNCSFMGNGIIFNSVKK